MNLSPHTIRFYAKEGLLTFVERDQNGNRIFKESDFERLFIIASLKRAGMSIKQILEFTILCDKGDSTIAPRLTLSLADALACPGENGVPAPRQALEQIAASAHADRLLDLLL